MRGIATWLGRAVKLHLRAAACFMRSANSRGARSLMTVDLPDETVDPNLRQSATHWADLVAALLTTETPEHVLSNRPSAPEHVGKMALNRFVGQTRIDSSQFIRPAEGRCLHQNPRCSLVAAMARAVGFH